MKKIIFKVLIGFLFLSGIGGCAVQSGSAEFVNEAVRVSTPNTEASEPAMAIDQDGNIYIVYVEHGADKAADIFLQKFDGGMKPQGDRVRVNINAGEGGAWRGDQPTIKAGADKKIYVGWNARVPVTDGAANNLMLSVSSDGGKSFTEPVKVNNDTAPASHGMHAMTVDGEKVYFAWLDERYLHNTPSHTAPKNGEGMAHGQPEPNAEVYFAVSKDGGKTFGENKKLAGDICPCCKVQMLAAKDGHVYVSWRQVLAGDMRHIAVAASGDSGENFGQPVIVSDDKWQLMACPVSGAPLAIDANGQLRVSWYTAGEAGATGLYSTDSKDNGRTFSPRTLMNKGAITGTPAMFYKEGSDFRLLWVANGMISSQLISDGNSTFSRELTEGELFAAATAGKHLFVSYVKKEGDKHSVWLSRAVN